MREQSKAAKRRYSIGDFHSKYFVGNGIDIGCGPDTLGQYVRIFPLLTSVQPYDQEHGDANLLDNIEDSSFMFLHSSHCLEHMVDPAIALENWVRVVMPGGHLIITVPDEDMYEQGTWPSVNNPDHKHTFTMYKKESWCKDSVNVLELVTKIDAVEVVKIERIEEFFNSEYQGDQTLQTNPECCIEIILRKHANS